MEPLDGVYRHPALRGRSGCSLQQKEKGFFHPRKRQRSATKLTEEIKREAQRLLEAGENVAEVGRRLNVLPTTLHKALQSKRLEVKKKI